LWQEIPKRLPECTLPRAKQGLGTAIQIDAMQALIEHDDTVRGTL
jgi:hypothetical protein